MTALDETGYSPQEKDNLDVASLPIWCKGDQKAFLNEYF